MCARDFAAAEEILGESPNKEVLFYNALVPPTIFTLWLEFVQGHHPTTEQFGAVREELYRRVEAQPTQPFLITALAFADAALGRQNESIQEGRRALEMRPISEDALEGPFLATLVAQIYAWTKQPEEAFAQLNILVKMPGSALSYGMLKTNPGWDPLRKDPRFEALLTALAPHD
ncbi:MAG TPA: hypothetical protein VN939_01365 [Chthoniobacterales bacterium]|nr:hypothetical protein [Chthoniobacterales bacterium]